MISHLNYSFSWKKNNLKYTLRKIALKESKKPQKTPLGALPGSNGIHAAENKHINFEKLQSKWFYNNNNLNFHIRHLILPIQCFQCDPWADINRASQQSNFFGDIFAAIFSFILPAPHIKKKRCKQFKHSFLYRCLKKMIAVSMKKASMPSVSTEITNNNNLQESFHLPKFPRGPCKVNKTFYANFMERRISLCALMLICLAEGCQLSCATSQQ